MALRSLSIADSNLRIIEPQSQSFSLAANLEEPIAGGKMSTIPAKKLEHNRDNPDGRNQVCARRHHTYEGETVSCFGLGGGT
jgi:hypothetical protein